MESGSLLTTGQVAALLGSSRQHVVDLCQRGELPFQSVGRHRRIRREDAESFARAVGGSAPLSRDELQSLWLHRAVAGRLAADPRGVLEKARRNLDLLADVHAGARSTRLLKTWRAAIEAGPEAVMRLLVSETSMAIELRQGSPFAGVLSDDERAAVLEGFRAQASVV